MYLICAGMNHLPVRSMNVEVYGLTLSYIF